MPEQQERWLDVEEISSYLGVTNETIRKWIREKNLPARKIGRKWKFKLTEVDEWVKSGQSAID